MLALGVIVASTLLAAAPIYARTMSDLGLTFVIRDELEEASSTRVLVRDVELGTAAGLQVVEAVDRRIEERIGWFTLSDALLRRSARIAYSADPAEAFTDGQPYLQLQALEGYNAHVGVSEGRLPELGEPGERLEVAVSPEALAAGGLQVGDTIYLHEFLNDCEQMIVLGEMPFVSPCPPGTPTLEAGFQIAATVVGVLEPLEPDGDFWPGGTAAYFAPRREIPGGGPQVPGFMHPQALEEQLGGILPGYQADTSWHIFADPELLNRDNFARALNDLYGLRTDLQTIDGVTISPLVATLERFQRGQSVQQTPLTILLLQIAGIALFYVGLISAIVVERQSDEIALLRSRGASVPQVMGVYLLEGLIIGMPTLFVAPLLATAATALLGLTPTFADVNEGELLPAVLVPQAFLWAAGGVVLSLLAVLAPVYVVGRRTAVTQRQQEARPSPSILHRYYLDLALAAFAGLLLWELNERGSAFEPSATGGVSTDPILLASPALIIAAAAALVLRFYPMVLRLVARLITIGAGVTVTMSLWQLVRRPGQYTRLTLLLMMGVAVGTFAASYSSTSERSYRDRANFAAGTDIRAGRIDRIQVPGGTPAVEQGLAEVDGVEAATLVFREGSRLGQVGTIGRGVTILGVDPTLAAGMLYSRDDFADESLRSLLFRLQGPSGMQGLVIPEGSTELRMWVNSTIVRADVTLWARIRGADGNHRLYEFGKLDQSGWREMTADIAGGTQPLALPGAVVGLVMTEPPNRFNTQESPVLLDDLRAIGPAVEVVLDDFEGVPRWAPLPSLETATDQFGISDNAQNGSGAGEFTFRLGVQNERRAMYVLDPIIPLAAVASESFLQSAGLTVGNLGTLRQGNLLVPIRIVGSYRLFPTLASTAGPSVVVNRDQLISYVNAFSATGTRPLQPNEAWLTVTPGESPAEVVLALAADPWRMAGFTDRQSELQRIASNPLLTAGGAGILVVSFAGVLLLIGAAFLVSLWTAVQRRQTEFAVLRAMGLSRLQLLRVLMFEYGLISIVGVTIGAYLGLVVGRRMLSFLNVTETGQRVEPEFILQTDWGMVAAGGGVVAAVFVLGLVMAVRVLARTNDAQALRNE